MATELGQAFIQIMPSAKGISGAIRQQLDPEADAAGSSAGQSLGGKFVSVLKGVIAAAAIGKFFQASLMEGQTCSNLLVALRRFSKDPLTR